MRPVGILVVLVLVVLQTARLSVGAPIDATIDTTVVPTTIDTTVVPTSVDSTIVQTTTFCAPPTCDDNCFLDTYSGGCPTQCICGDPICMLVSCGADADCVQTNESPEGYICVPRYATTLEPTSDPTIETSAPPCEDLSWCTGSCYLDYGYNYLTYGCPTCICADYWGSPCEYASCGPDQNCIQNGDYFWDYTCAPRYDIATELPTCPTIDCDSNPYCNVEYGPDGCPAYCSCGDPICMLVSCGSGEECVENKYDPYDYSCVSTTGTTTTSDSVEDPCPPQDPCNKRCMYGLQTDKSGCQLCECLEEPTP